MKMERNQKMVDDYYKKELAKGTNLYGTGYSQTERFRNALSYFNTKDKGVLEIGSGKGDFARIIFVLGKKPKTYWGLDILPEMEKIAKKNVRHRGFTFSTGDFLNTDVLPEGYGIFDLVFSFSTFDRKFGDQLGTKYYAFKMLEKMYEYCRVGVYCTFLSAWKNINDSNEALFYPEEVLAEVHRYCERVVIDHSFMPHAFAVVLKKEKSPWRVEYERETIKHK
jgi:SAM-dependent methyltransferase